MGGLSSPRVLDLDQFHLPFMEQLLGLYRLATILEPYLWLYGSMACSKSTILGSNSGSMDRARDFKIEPKIEKN